MANNAQAGAAVGVGEIFNTTDLTTFTGHSATGELPGAMLFVGAAGTATAPTSVTNANPLPISDAGGSITVDSATFATETTLAAASAKLPAALGQAAMAASLSVVIASNQSAVPISVASLPLPSGAATSANQTTELVSLASIDGKLPALVGGLVPITIAGQTGTVTVGVSGSVAVTGTFFQATQPVSIAGTVTVAGAVTNAGTFAVQIDAGAVTSLALIDDVIFADDAAFTPATSKVAAIGMQVDETATDSVDEGDIGCPRMTLDRKARVVDTPHTAGGLSVSSFLSTAAVQSTAVKASPGQVYAIEFFNIGSTPMYVRLYNQTGAPAGGDNANIVWRGIIPGNTAGAGFVKTWDKGLEFTSGIGLRCTGAISDTDTTVLAANTVVGNVEFK